MDDRPAQELLRPKIIQAIDLKNSRILFLRNATRTVISDYATRRQRDYNCCLMTLNLAGNMPAL